MSEETKDINSEIKKVEDTDNNEVTPQWKALGYETEDEFVDKALDWQKKAEKAEELEKVRDKQAADYRKQSNEVGDLNKEVKSLREYRRNAETQSLKKLEEQEIPVNLDKVLADLDETKLKAMDEFLDKPENVELKKKVVDGGEEAMVEFAQSYGKSVPQDLSKPLFQGMIQKQAKNSVLDQSSITGMVQNAFRQLDNETKKTIPAGEHGGMAMPEGNQQQKQTPVIGGVEADYFRAKKE